MADLREFAQAADDTEEDDEEVAVPTEGEGEDKERGGMLDAAASGIGFERCYIIPLSLYTCMCMYVCVCVCVCMYAYDYIRMCVYMCM